MLSVLAACLGSNVAPALAARGHVFCEACTFGAPGSSNGQFNEPAGIAVNEATGDVYVVDKGNNRVEYFNAEGIYQGEFNGSGLLLNECNTLGECKTAGSGGLPDEEETGRFSEPQSIALDNAPNSTSYGDVYVTDGFSHKVIDKFTSTGEYVGQITGKTAELPGGRFEQVEGVAVDTKGKLWVAEEDEGVQRIDGFNAEANVFDGSCDTFLPASGHDRHGLAVDSTDDLYLRSDAGLGVVVKLDSHCRVLNEAVAGEFSSGVAFNGVATETSSTEPSSNDVYIDNYESVGRFSPTGDLLERFGEGHLAGPHCSEQSCQDGVAVDSSTDRVYVGDPSANAIQAYKLAPPAAPSVVSESLSDVTDDSAILRAEINPRSVPAEAPTVYRFEYGVCTSLATCAASAYGRETPLASLSPSFEVEGASAEVQDLLAGTTYHFRVIAENEISNGEGRPIEGREESFTTRGTGEFILPDGRQWEMVSPPEKNGAFFNTLGTEGPIQAAADGAAITYLANTPTESEPRGTSFGTQVLSTRGPGGWSSRDLALPHGEATSFDVGGGTEYRFFSEDLSFAVVQPFGAFVALSPDASEQTAYREDVQAASYTPFVTGCPSEGRPCEPSVREHANVPDGTVFGVDVVGASQAHESCPPEVICGPVFVGGTPDLSHVVLLSQVALTVGGEPGLYEFSGGKPASEQLQFLAGGGAELGFATPVGEGYASRHAISDDGSRVYWTKAGQLYMSNTVRHEPETLHLGGSSEQQFQAANSEGTRVIFTEGGDLYECDIPVQAGPLKCEPTDLAPSGGVVGSVLGTSDDGSWVYFAADGVLAPGAVGGDCPSKGTQEMRASDNCNLYVRHNGVTRLVAVVSGADEPDWGEELINLTARVSPDGEWVAFMSQRSLTGYDNRDALSGKLDEEVYLYDGRTERLVCASCDPTGARPHGMEYANMHLTNELGEVWSPTTWLAASVPGWSPYRLVSAIYQSRYLANSGRLFFDSSDALVPKDVNGTEDVYEYEPEGVPAGEHACARATSSGSSTLKPAQGFEVEGRKGEEGAGCISLISSSGSAQESAFLDASETGSDVFFLTTAKLAPQDFDDALDVYDAHECTTQSPCPPLLASPPPPCGTESSCKRAPSPQPAIFGLSGSATFSGAGNLVPSPPTKVTKKTVKCKRGFVKNKKHRCVKSRQRKKAKKASSNRRGK